MTSWVGPFLFYGRVLSILLKKGADSMKKGIRSILAVLVSFCLLVSAMPASAAGSMANFQKTRDYPEGLFTDIQADEWFYSEIINAYCYGLANGTSESEFTPYGLVSLAEVIAFAARIHSTYTGDGADLNAAEGQAWYEPSVSYARESEIIGADEFTGNLEVPASRAQMVYVLAHSLPYTEFENINTSIDALPDVSDEDAYYNEIIMLYRAGVVAGKDEYGKFSPNENVNRCEAVAVINRIVDPASRRQFTLVAEPDDNTESAGMDAVAISEQAGPSVFYIEVYNQAGQATASGSGFFIDSDGTAVTNFHVIEDAYSAKIKTIDGSVYDVAYVYGYDADKDLAILKIEGEGFPALTLGNSDELKNGQKIFCIGSPLGLENTISEGVVSNNNREIEGQTYIQISAPISHGSSGGAVLDDSCRVVGVSSGGFEEGQSLNVAIPSNTINTIDRSQQITLYELQTGSSGNVDNPQTGLQGEIDANDPTLFYTDNPQIPDYGVVTGAQQIAEQMDESSGIVLRTYQFDAAQYVGYVQALRSIGFTQIRQQVSNYTIAVMLEKAGNPVIVEADYTTSSVGVWYYNASYIPSASEERYYSGTDVLDYSFITGRSLKEMSTQEDGTTIYRYALDANEAVSYVRALGREGFRFYERFNSELGPTYIYANSNATVVSVSLFSGINEVWITIA